MPADVKRPDDDRRARIAHLHGRERIQAVGNLASLLREGSVAMPSRLPIEDMHERHRALTPPVAAALHEAARVCLSRHHRSPAEFNLYNNGTNTTAEVEWVAPDGRVIDAWANIVDTTEDGACCCVIAGLEEVRGLHAVRRAETGTGADYYVGPPGSGINDLEDCLRLEVSGLDKGDSKAVLKRLSEKVNQAGRGSSSLPAIAGVVGFLAKTMMLRDVT